MLSKKAVMILAILAVGCLVLIFSPYIIKTGSEVIGSIGTLAGAFIVFIALLELPLDRVPKGFYLIMYGVLFKTGYLVLLEKYIPQNLASEDLKMQLSIYGDVILLACSGAGGSIIANHADKSSLDYEKTTDNRKTIDNTENIKALIQKTKNLTSKTNTIIFLLATLLTINMVTLLFRLK